MKGQFKFTPEAEEWFSQWYFTMTDTMQTKMPHTFEGYVNRRPTHIQKAAMILSASRSSSRVIEVKDLERALDLHERTEVRMPRTFAGVGASRLSPVIERIKQFIARHDAVTLGDLHSEFGNDFDGERQFVDQLTALVSQGFCKYMKKSDGTVIVKYLTTHKTHAMYGGMRI